MPEVKRQRRQRTLACCLHVSEMGSIEDSWDFHPNSSDEKCDDLPLGSPTFSEASFSTEASSTYSFGQDQSFEGLENVPVFNLKRLSFGCSPETIHTTFEQSLTLGF